MKKKLLFVVLGLMVLLFVGCKEAPNSRELVVVNKTSDANITGIEVETFFYGHSKVVSYNPNNYLEGADPLTLNKSFSITLSPYIYGIVVKIDFNVLDPDSKSNQTVEVKYNEKPELPTIITLVKKEDHYTLEVSGEYSSFKFVPTDE